MKHHKEVYRPKDDKHQANFFQIVPEYIPKVTGPTPPENIRVTTDTLIDRMHVIFQKSGNGAAIKRDKILGKEGLYYRQQLLKALGVTERAKTARMKEQWAHAIQRLTDAGVLDLLHPNMTQEEERELITKLQQYDRDYRQPIRDLDSSEGFTIYPTVKSWYRDHTG
jgi:hypothetical protein